ARLLRKARKYDSAVRGLERALAFHPENHQLVSCAMELVLELKERHRAANIFTKYLEANLEARRDDRLQAEQTLAGCDSVVEEGDQQTSESAMELIREASSLIENADLDKAREVVLNALHAHPTQPQAYLLYGDYHLRIKDFAAAARGYFAALSFDPENEAARRGLLDASRMHDKRDLPVRGEPEFSVLLATYNRADCLRKCLAGCCVQTFSPERFEIVIVDDGSEDGTPAVVKSFEPYLNIRYLHQAHAGLAAARTLLTQNARSALLGFFDDDDIVAPTCVEEHWKAHQQYPDENVAVLGYSEWCPSLNVTPLMHYVTHVGKHYVDYTSLTHGQFYDFRCFWGGRSSCKKELLDGRELYDPEFTFTQDIELAYRLSRRRPFRVLYHESAVHRFLEPMDLDRFLRRTVGKGRAARLFLDKHPDPALHSYLPVEDALSKWANLEPICDKLVELAHKLEEVVGKKRPASMEAEECKELFVVYSQLYQAAWLKGVLAGQKEKREPAIRNAR
ncbi:MAG: glycosyltransferase, partial [Candidatus Hydrogenedentes bacterium]|nr:glycosyltransferase [Candidatus Hydrogenedentota bacterium]